MMSAEGGDMNNRNVEGYAQSVKGMFNRITPHYDLLNRLLSGRRDVAWRRFAAKRIPPEARLILDVACGTGDLAIEICRRRPGTEVYAVDFAQKMMEFGVLKSVKRGLNSRIHFIGGNALKLPFPDDTFDVCGAAFGLRNIPDKLSALKEMRRVVKPGGRVFILEMTFPRDLKLRRLFLWYFRNVMPRVGRMISGDRNAYRYLPDSIQDFLPPEELSALFIEAGLAEVKAFPLHWGMTYLHEGAKKNDE